MSNNTNLLLSGHNVTDHLFKGLSFNSEI